MHYIQLLIDSYQIEATDPKLEEITSHEHLKFNTKRTGH
jgi:hypothetical protein